MTKLTDELDAVQSSNQMWGKRPDMIVRGRLPFNAEPPPSVLADGEITAVDTFYARNHGPFPDIRADQWRLNIDGRVDKPLTLTYDELTSGFTAHSVVATLVCAGNRRAELLNVHPIPGKDPWGTGRSRPPNGAEPGWPTYSPRLACTRGWTACGVPRPRRRPGSRPRAVLRQLDPANQGDVGRSAAGLADEWPAVAAGARRPGAGGGARLHRGPQRQVGHHDHRATRTLENYFQALDYRILPPEADADTVPEGEGISLSSLPLNCDILVPTDDEPVTAGALTVRLGDRWRRPQRRACRRVARRWPQLAPSRPAPGS